jgi:ribosomal protein S18 acetylase RimI-like enzyme
VANRSLMVETDQMIASIRVGSGRWWAAQLSRHVWSRLVGRGGSRRVALVANREHAELGWYDRLPNCGKCFDSGHLQFQFIEEAFSQLFVPTAPIQKVEIHDERTYEVRRIFGHRVPK